MGGGVGVGCGGEVLLGIIYDEKIVKMVRSDLKMVQNYKISTFPSFKI